jgi:lactate dehydrogenase-like 2-hydroxyacid dehydrogenase
MSGAGGAGEIGQEEARRCGNAFDMTIYVFTRDQEC